MYTVNTHSIIKRTCLVKEHSFITCIWRGAQRKYVKDLRHSAHLATAHSFLPHIGQGHTVSFCVFGDSAQFHSEQSVYKQKLFPRILKIKGRTLCKIKFIFKYSFGQDSSDQVAAVTVLSMEKNKSKKSHSRASLGPKSS
jgi:hypothetical protein